MRVAFLISGSLDTLTGGYIYDRQLVDYFRQNGHQVEILQLPGGSYFDRLRHSPALPLSVELKHLSADILLEDELDHPALIFFNRRIKSQVNCPIISIVHNLHCCELREKWKNNLYRRIEKYYLMSADGFIFNSRTTRQVVENLVGTAKPGVIANPCGNRLPARITESEIVERSGKSGPLRILFLGNLFRNKSLHVLLAALADLPENSCFLTVVGDLTMDRPYVKTIKEQIQRYSLNLQVSLLGPLNDNDLASKIKENHVLAVPSFYEGFGIAYLEGMRCGLPAIGTTAGGAAEIIAHGRDGFLIAPGDSQTLSLYLNELNQNRDRLTSMSLNAFRSSSVRPTWKMTSERVLNFLLSLQSAI